jgi:rhodanese-related sulfurtransferase
MKKRDRTSEEKQFDANLRAAIQKLGQPAEPDAPKAYRHTLVWDRLGRRGQACRILRQRGVLAQIEFEDGFASWINRMAIRRT